MYRTNYYSPEMEDNADFSLPLSTSFTVLTWKLIFDMKKIVIVHLQVNLEFLFKILRQQLFGLWKCTSIFQCLSVLQSVFCRVTKWEIFNLFLCPRLFGGGIKFYPYPFVCPSVHTSQIIFHSPTLVCSSSTKCYETST